MGAATSPRGLPVCPASLAAPFPAPCPCLLAPQSQAGTLLNFLGKAQLMTRPHKRRMSHLLRACPSTCIYRCPTQQACTHPNLSFLTRFQSPGKCFPSLLTHTCACMYTCAHPPHTHAQSWPVQPGALLGPQAARPARPEVSVTQLSSSSPLAAVFLRRDGDQQPARGADSRVERPLQHRQPSPE